MKSLLLALALLAVSFDSPAVGRLACVEVMNRDTGQVLPVYRARGDYWVAGTPGARYAVVIRNQAGERLLAVTSVDGVNVISGDAAAFEQSGYVFSADERYAIEGWRKSNQEIAAFNFTALPDSYAARTGRAANVGVIGVALFLEWPASALQPAPPVTDADLAHAPAGRSAASPLRRRTETADDPAASRLGTGHGARESSYVASTPFERRSSRPDEVVRIRYDRYDNLVAMGVLRARPRPAVPNAFPDAPEEHFVPDPPGQ